MFRNNIGARSNHMTIPRSLISAIFILFLVSCKTDDAPDVSNIKVDLQVQRFEKDLFAVDTNQLQQGLEQVAKKYPIFFSDFTGNILGLPPLSESPEAYTALRSFISSFRPIKDSTDKIFTDFDETAEEVKKGLQYVKHYFPEYPLPRKLISFIGPMDAYFEASLGSYGDAITSDALVVGLQLHMGRNFSLYQSQQGQALYPAYISKRFTKETIPVNCMKNIIDDLYPDRSGSKTLVEQMVEKGKRLYILDKLMPHTEDSLLIGYTKNELQGCYKNEGLIWNYFLTNNLVFNNDPGMIKNYVGDAPSTPEFGEGAPGYIGLFVGWQIVKKYMEEHETTKLTDLMRKDARQLFEESKYRPK